MVVDLAFGDCGKGTIVDFLTRRCSAQMVVRFNGGPQAAHHVVTRDGRHHMFSQLGAGTFVPGVRTLLSRFMLIEPYALFNEVAHLAAIGVGDALDRLHIDRRCPVITPLHQAANRLRELVRGNAAHGTCGVGVGEVMEDRIHHPHAILHAAELADRATVRRKLRVIHEIKTEQLRDTAAQLKTHPRARACIETLQKLSWIESAIEVYAALAARVARVDESQVAKLLLTGGTSIFEGAQGVLLDESFGFHPHTTWSDTTFSNADSLLRDAGCEGPRTRVGVLRTYFTRHGPGPFVTEDRSLRPLLAESHNDDADWPGPFRVGVFDAVAARYAVAVAGPIDFLAITHVDQVARLPSRICNAYRSAAAPDPSSDSELFVWKADRIVNLRISNPARLCHQAELTDRLFNCRPEFQPLPGKDADAFLHAICTELAAPIGIASFGPTAEDKQLLAADGISMKNQ